jgi:hypothetical protein
VGLVGVAGLGRHDGGGVAGREAVGGVVEADQLGGPLGREAHLGAEAGPQALAAPAQLVGEPVDPDLPSPGDHPAPDVGHLGVQLPAVLQEAAEEGGLGDGEPVVPAGGGAELVVDPVGVASPEGVEGDGGTALGQVRRARQHGVGDVRRQAQLQALDVVAVSPDAGGGHADGEAAVVLGAGGRVLDDHLAVQVDQHGDRRERDDPQVDRRRGPGPEAGHRHSGKPAGEPAGTAGPAGCAAGTGRRGDVPHVARPVQRPVERLVARVVHDGSRWSGSAHAGRLRAGSGAAAATFVQDAAPEADRH